MSSTRRTRLRNSLAVKVIFSTVVLSLVLFGIVGSALYNKFSDGILNVKLDSSIAETRSAVFNAQYRFSFVGNSKQAVIGSIVKDIVANSATISATVNGREIALLRSGALTSGEVDYQSTSNLVNPSVIPEELRKRVRKNLGTEWALTTITYASGNRIPGLAVGQTITIPTVGRYEMYLIFSLVNQNATLDLVRTYLLIAGIFLLFLIGLITWLVVRQVVKPVQDAARIAEKFTTGDFGQRMPIKSNDEIASLGTSFNDMASSLQTQILRLENLSLVQQRFVSDVSHELRTPLTTLRMASDVVHSARNNFDPSVARSAELLAAQIDRFDRLLEDLLEVSRFDAEVAVLESVKFDISELIERCIADLSLVAKERGAEIDFSSTGYAVMIEADSRRVERILRNLINNAIEYSDSKPVQVKIVESQGTIAVGVRDHGIGLEAEAAFRVFDRFWRADPSRARVRGGTGLGLSIALEDARLHNGELEAWGRPGKGAHFVLTLPKEAGQQIESRLIRLEPLDYYSTEF